MYSEAQLFEILLSAAGNRKTLLPDARLASAYAKARYNKAMRSLRSRNLLVPAIGKFHLANPNDTYTCYTPPLSDDVIVCGLTLSSLSATQGTIFSPDFVGEIRIRRPNGPAIGANLLNVQQQFKATRMNWRFPAPFILRANDQLAMDVGFNVPAGVVFTGQPVFTLFSEGATEQQFAIFWCVAVKDCLSDDDQIVAELIKREIQDQPFQRPVMLPSGTLNSQFQMVEFTSLTSTVSSTTRTAERPLLITGIQTNLSRSRVKINDTYDDHAFTLNTFVNARNFACYEEQENTHIQMWQDFPIPHLLRTGAAITCEHQNQLIAPPWPTGGGGLTQFSDKYIGATPTFPLQFQSIVFKGVTV